MSIAKAQILSCSKFSFAIVLTSLLIVFSSIHIYDSHAQPIYDQGVLIEFSFTTGYPGLEQGITSNLIIGLVNFFKSHDPLTSNALIRILAASLYLISSSLLAWALTKRYFLGLEWFTLFILLIFTSRFPFLWLSSELFAGTFLMLIMWSMINECPFAITAFFVALFSWAKPDLLIPGLAFGIVLALYDQKEFRNKILSVSMILLMIVAFVIPGLILKGTSFLELSNRSFQSFCQHYASMVSSHQIIRPVPDPWLECQTYTKSTFGNAQKVSEIIVGNGSKYMDFVFLSLSQSLQKMVVSNLIFLIPLAATGLWATQHKKINVAVIFLFFINFGLIIMLSYFHVRYQARYYPLALLMAFIGMSERKPKNIQLFLWGYLLALLFFQMYQSVPIVNIGYFFID
ncbi:MAG TPA: hypothetical protein VK206_09380 [Anaerolineales bacterium]|nr:hypothetical protein [Anaerolineales bacterium]